MADKVYKFRDKKSGKIYEMPWDKEDKPTPYELATFADRQDNPTFGDKASKLWESANKPLWEGPSRWAKAAADKIDAGTTDNSKDIGFGGNPYIRGFASGALRGAGDLASSFTSPISAGLTAATMGSGTAAKMGLTGTSRAIGALGKAASAGLGAHGAYEAGTGIYEGDLTKIGQGALEVAGAGLAYHSMIPRPRTVGSVTSDRAPIEDPRRMLEAPLPSVEQVDIPQPPKPKPPPTVTQVPMDQPLSSVAPKPGGLPPKPQAGLPPAGPENFGPGGDFQGPQQGPFYGGQTGTVSTNINEPATRTFTGGPGMSGVGRPPVRNWADAQSRLSSLEGNQPLAQQSTVPNRDILPQTSPYDMGMQRQGMSSNLPVLEGEVMPPKPPGPITGAPGLDPVAAKIAANEARIAELQQKIAKPKPAAARPLAKETDANIQHLAQTGDMTAQAELAARSQLGNITQPPAPPKAPIPDIAAAPSAPPTKVVKPPISLIPLEGETSKQFQKRTGLGASEAAMIYNKAKAPKTAPRPQPASPKELGLARPHSGLSDAELTPLVKARDPEAVLEAARRPTMAKATGDIVKKAAKKPVKIDPFDAEAAGRKRSRVENEWREEMLSDGHKPDVIDAAIDVARQHKIDLSEIWSFSDLNEKIATLKEAPTKGKKGGKVFTSLASQVDKLKTEMARLKGEQGSIGPDVKAGMEARKARLGREEPLGDIDEEAFKKAALAKRAGQFAQMKKEADLAGSFRSNTRMTEEGLTPQARPKLEALSEGPKSSEIAHASWADEMKAAGHDELAVDALVKRAEKQGANISGTKDPIDAKSYLDEIEQPADKLGRLSEEGLKGGTEKTHPFAGGGERSIIGKIWDKLSEETGAVGDLANIKKRTTGMFKDRHTSNGQLHGEELDLENLRADVDRGLNFPNTPTHKKIAVAQGELYGTKYMNEPVKDNIIRRRALEHKLEQLPENNTYPKDSKRGRRLRAIKEGLINEINRLSDETGAAGPDLKKAKAAKAAAKEAKRQAANKPPSDLFDKQDPELDSSDYAEPFKHEDFLSSLRKSLAKEGQRLKGEKGAITSSPFKQSPQEIAGRKITRRWIHKSEAARKWASNAYEDVKSGKKSGQDVIGKMWDEQKAAFVKPIAVEGSSPEQVRDYIHKAKRKIADSQYWDALDVGNFLEKPGKIDTSTPHGELMNEWRKNHLNKAARWSKVGGSMADTAKNIYMAGGIPGTPLNIHGWNIARSDIQARGFAKGLKGLKEGVFNPSRDRAVIEKYRDLIPQAMERGFKWYEHEGLSPEGRPAPQATSKVGKAGAWALGKVRKTFEAPLFERYLPAKKLQNLGYAYDYLKDKGLSHDEALTKASTFANDFFGSVDNVLRNKTGKNLAKTIMLAPEWFENRLRLGAKQFASATRVIKSPMHGTIRPEDPLYAKALARALTIRLTKEAAVIAGGAAAWNAYQESKSSSVTDIPAGETESGRRREIPTLGTSSEVLRLGEEGLNKMYKEEDPGVPFELLKNRLGQPAASTGHLIFNTDEFGNALYGQGKFGKPIGFGKGMFNILDQATRSVQPQQVQALNDYLQGNIGGEEAFAKALELPIQYRSQTTFGQIRRKRRRR